eukprot:COSAG01_NODE_389_length_17708_cov_111.404452_10_plen_194_part_00
MLWPWLPGAGCGVGACWLVIGWLWSQLTSKCQRFGHPPRLNNQPFATQVATRRQLQLVRQAKQQLQGHLQAGRREEAFAIRWVRVRVRVEIMGSQTCRIVGKSQPVLVMSNPIIFTSTRTSRRGGAAQLLGQSHSCRRLRGAYALATSRADRAANCERRPCGREGMQGGAAGARVTAGWRCGVRCVLLGGRFG